MNRLMQKENAKKVIKGRVLISFLVLFVLFLITGGIDAIIARMDMPLVSFVIGIAVFILTMPLQNGAYLYFYNISTDKTEDFSDLFKPYQNGAFKELVKAKLIVYLYVILGLICFIIPGIYFSIKYAMVDYIFAENPKTLYREAMAESAAIMKGKIWDYFVLMLSFILWYLLVALTFGFAAIYVMPYVYATTAQFYLSVRRTGDIIVLSPDSTGYFPDDKDYPPSGIYGVDKDKE
ncbi:MAG: DUF975 family protein [Clostridia bacterium]